MIQSQTLTGKCMPTMLQPLFESLESGNVREAGGIILERDHAILGDQFVLRLHHRRYILLLDRSVVLDGCADQAAGVGRSDSAQVVGQSLHRDGIGLKLASGASLPVARLLSD